MRQVELRDTAAVGLRHGRPGLVEVERVDVLSLVMPDVGFEDVSGHFVDDAHVSTPAGG